MGKPTGFLEYERKVSEMENPKQRIGNFDEFHIYLSREEQRLQGARCMNCGVPFCQSGMMLMGMASGCPLHNLIPEWNDLAWRGSFREAYERLSKTNNFPEFTSRVCPALCEAACTCGLYDDPVSTKENEYRIIENAFENGFVSPNPPKTPSTEATMVIGSGPAERVREVVAPVVGDAGLVLENVQVAPAGRRTVVRVVVDLDDEAIGSLDSDRLATVSRAISAALDAADPVKGAYVLEVSTPGTDRPLVELRHFRRARTRLVRLALHDGSVVVGRLREADEHGLVLEADEAVTTLPLASVARGAVQVELTHTDEQEEES